MDLALSTLHPHTLHQQRSRPPAPPTHCSSLASSPSLVAREALQKYKCERFLFGYLQSLPGSLTLNIKTESFSTSYKVPQCLTPPASHITQSSSYGPNAFLEPSESTHPKSPHSPFRAPKSAATYSPISGTHVLTCSHPLPLR